MTDEQTKIKYDSNDETTAIDGEVRWRFVVGLDAKDPEPDEKKRRPLAIHLAKPNEEQLLVLLRLMDLAEDDGVATVRLFADVIDALMAPGESHRCQRWLLQGRIKAEQFANIASSVIEHYWPEEFKKVTAPKNGPTARPRARRR
jgi:hypothetical protein